MAFEVCLWGPTVWVVCGTKSLTQRSRQVGDVSPSTEVDQAEGRGSALSGVQETPKSSTRLVCERFELIILLRECRDYYLETSCPQQILVSTQGSALW